MVIKILKYLLHIIPYIDRNEPKTVEQFFKSNIAVIQVFEY